MGDLPIASPIPTQEIKKEREKGETLISMGFEPGNTVFLLPKTLRASETAVVTSDSLPL
jgi:hypothetical protein